MVSSRPSWRPSTRLLGGAQLPSDRSFLTALRLPPRSRESTATLRPRASSHRSKLFVSSGSSSAASQLSQLPHPLRQRLRRVPPGGAVVQHHVQHRVRGIALAPPAVAVLPLVHQAAVVQEPQRHRVVHRRLMLNQHLHRLRAAVGGAPVDRPDHVAEAPAQVVGDLLGRAFAQGVEVERVSPTGRAQRGDEAEDQVLDDAPMIEQGACTKGRSWGLRR